MAKKDFECFEESVIYGLRRGKKNDFYYYQRWHQIEWLEITLVASGAA